MFINISAWLSRKGYAQGVFFLLTMMLVSATNDTLTKFMGERLPPFEIMFFRFFFTITTLIPFVTHKGAAIFKTQMLGLNIARGALGFVGFAAFVYSVIHIKLVEVVTIFWTIPLFVLVLSLIFLKEKVTLSRWIATIVGFIGLTTISTLSSNEESFAISFNAIYLIPIASAFVFSIQDVMIKKMVATEDSLTMMFYFALVTTILSLPFAICVWKTPTMHEFLILFMLGVGGNLMQYFIFKAFNATDLSALAPFRYVEFLISAIFGAVFFTEIPGINVLIGATILIPSTLYLAWNEKFVQKKAKKSRA